MATYQKTVWNMGDVITAELMNKIENQLELITPFVEYNFINKFSISQPSSGSIEIGHNTANVELTWTFKATPPSITLNGVSKNTLINQETVTAVDDGTHKVKYTLATPYDSKEVTFYFYPKLYWGAAVIPQTFDSAFVVGLSNKMLAKSQETQITVDAPTGSGKYIWFASPAIYGECSFSVNGYGGGFEEPQLVTVTNDSGYVQNYYVYRSGEANLGLTTVDIIKTV